MIRMSRNGKWYSCKHGVQFPLSAILYVSFTRSINFGLRRAAGAGGDHSLERSSVLNDVQRAMKLFLEESLRCLDQLSLQPASLVAP